MPGTERPDFQRTKQEIAALRELDRRLQTASEQGTRLEQAVIDAAAAWVDAKVSADLDGFDVEELNRDKSGIRVGVLRAAGYDTVGKVARARISELVAVNGIGEVMAKRASQNAGELADSLRSTASIRLSSDDRTPASDALVLALYQLRWLTPTSQKIRGVFRQYHEEAEEALREAAKVGSGLGWLFSSRHKKEDMLRGAARVEALLSGPYGADTQNALKTFESGAALSPDEAWEDFRRSAAADYAILERLVPQFVRRDDNFGLPAPLAEEVQNTGMDLQGLKCTLRHYQEFGVRYILLQKKVRLGDEMGLGKTVQAIAAMVALRNAGQRHFLVVCPASVLINWCREIVQHSDLVPLKLHGGDLSENRARWLREGGVAVTTYETSIRLLLPEEQRIALLVADEAHYVKNPGALRTQSLLSLIRRSDRVLYMTGTPLENRVEEMCFLVRSLQPQIADKLQGMQQLAKAPEFRQAAAPVYFRRTREDVLTELPDKIESEEWCDMTNAEFAVYAAHTLGRRFMDMRQVSWNVKDLKDSSKAGRLLELVEMAKEEGRRIIVFSFFLNTLRRVQELLGDACLPAVTGSVSSLKRQEIIDSFRDAPAGTVLPAQIQAGGTGLNIQAASVVIFCEPQIKPSLETQAISRAYRMGQVRKVLVYRLLCDDSIDERIMERLREKQEQFDSFADESYSGRESLLLGDLTEGALIDREIARITAGR